MAGSLSEIHQVSLPFAILYTWVKDGYYQSEVSGARTLDNKQVMAEPRIFQPEVKRVN